MKKFFPLFFVCTVTAFVSSGVAGPNDPTELGVQVGYLVIEGDSDVKNALVYGARFGSYLSARTSIEVSLLGGQSSVRNTGYDADVLLPTLEGNYHFGEGLWRPYLTAGGGLMQSNRDRRVDSNQIDPVLLYGGGVKYYLNPFCAARGDVRHILNLESGTGTNNLLVSLGLSWMYGAAEQTSPAKKKTKAVAVKKQMPPTDFDSDGDTIPDAVDRCPDTPPHTSVNWVGCPQDADHDGVNDDNDFCADTPYGVAVNARGCVASDDTDNDGVDDSKDDCPGTPVGVAVGVDGCPVEAKAVPMENWVLVGTTFEKNADKLSESKQAALDEAVEILKTHTKVRVEIQGHTDSLGKPDFNQKLSQRRALSVKTYLVKHGVSAERLETVGYGETKPIATNTTPEGRAKNRRIEFKVLSR